MLKTTEFSKIIAQKLIYDNYTRIMKHDGNTCKKCQNWNSMIKQMIKLKILK